MSPFVKFVVGVASTVALYLAFFAFNTDRPGIFVSLAVFAIALAVFLISFTRGEGRRRVGVRPEHVAQDARPPDVERDDDHRPD